MRKALFFLFIFLQIFVISCSKKQITLQPNSLKWPNSHEKSVDSIYINKVEDKRPKPSNILGGGFPNLFSKVVPIVFNSNLADYLKMNFNNLISNSPDTLNKIPVNVEINKFTLNGYPGGSEQTIINRYSYTFSYPITNNNFQKVIILDSVLTLNDERDTSSFQLNFELGIFKTANEFNEFYKANPSKLNLNNDSAISFDSNSMNNQITFKTDTAKSFSSTRLRKLLAIGYYPEGTYLESGGYLGYYYMLNLKGSHFEYGSGFALSYLNIKSIAVFNRPNFVTFNFPIILRYYFAEEPEYFYLTGMMKLAGGKETITSSTTKETNYFFGPILEFGLGFQIAQAVDFEAGIHQIYLWGSKVMPNDFGFNAALHISFGYK